MASASKGLSRATAALAPLLALAAGSGVFLDAYRHETEFARNGYRGADVVSFALVLPLLLLAAGMARRGSTRGHLLWLGSLGYVVYQCGYTFACWSRLFPVYLVLLPLSAFTLARALIVTDATAIAARVGAETPTRAIANYLWCIGAGLGVMEVAQIVGALVTGDSPRIVRDTLHPTSPVYVLDLGLVVPLLLMAGAWLRARRPWGYVASAILLVKGVTVGLGLLFANVFAALDGGRTDGALIGLWVAIAAGSVYSLVRLLRNVVDRDDAELATSRHAHDVRGMYPSPASRTRPRGRSAGAHVRSLRPRQR